MFISKEVEKKSFEITGVYPVDDRKRLWIRLEKEEDVWTNLLKIFEI